MISRLTEEQASIFAHRYAPLAHHLVAALSVALGDPPPPNWRAAPAADRESTIEALFEAITHPDRTPRQEHERWAAAKRADGWAWADYGNNTEKFHPRLIDYDRLPPEQKVKDALFVELGAAIREGRLP